MSLWTNWCLLSWSVPLGDVSDENPILRLDSDPVTSGWDVCVSVIAWCGIVVEGDNEKKWEALKTI